MEPGLATLFGVFFRIGLFTFGGGYAMLPLIRREVVLAQPWVGEDEFLDIVAVSQTAPGPIAVNSALFTGYKLRGVSGAVAAGLGVVVPSFLVMLAVASVFTELRGHPLVERVFRGIRPAVFALVLAAVVKLGRRAITTPRAALVFAVGLPLLLVLGVHPIWYLLGAAAAGLSLAR